MPIQFIGLNVLDLEEIDELKKLTSEYYKKIVRNVKKGTLIVRVKKYEKGGKAKFSVHARVNDPNLILTAQESEWDLAMCVHRVFKKLENEIKHKYKTEGLPSEKLHLRQE